jgi:hypothetical protein
MGLAIFVAAAAANIIEISDRGLWGHISVQQGRDSKYGHPNVSPIVEKKTLAAIYVHQYIWNLPGNKSLFAVQGCGKKICWKIFRVPNKN